MSRVAVLGGGIAGIVSAALLAADGHEVELFEKSAELGGRAGRWDARGFRFDTGPSWYLMPEVFDHAFRLLGTTAADELDLVRLDPAYRVFFDGADPLDVRSGRAAAVAQFEGIEPGAGARLSAHLDSAARTYRLANDRFLYTDFSHPRAFVPGRALRELPALSRLLGRSLQSLVEGSFTDPRLRQILQYPAVFLGASPALAPALFHLMSTFDLDDGVLYPRGGLGVVVDAFSRLAAEAGVAVHTRTPVRRILVDGRAVRGILVERHGALCEERFDRVVSAVDMHHSDTALLPGRSRERSLRHWDRSNPGTGAVLAMLGVRGRLPELRHHNLVFTRDWQANFDAIFGAVPRVPDPASFYACMPSATDATVAPEGHENLFLLVPVPADPGIGSGGLEGAGAAEVEAVVDRAIAALAEHAGAPDLPERVVLRRTVGPADFERDLHSWRGSALGPAHTLRQSAFLRGRTRSRRTRGLFYAGATTIPGIGLPMCLISAELVLKAFRGDRSTGPLPVAETQRWV
ncbi:phytoene desaturase family protein [Microbacterium sp. 8M]|uniref:phytoene desaturase family protein n=1 Tax=Microbacterium sp. 8M TaxID=2653153 RepID=UPI0019164A98|nr:phytoene desaturase family protein [Microbacterium sp. 8M]